MSDIRYPIGPGFDKINYSLVLGDISLVVSLTSFPSNGVVNHRLVHQSQKLRKRPTRSVEWTSKTSLDQEQCAIVTLWSPVTGLPCCSMAAAPAREVVKKKHKKNSLALLPRQSCSRAEGYVKLEA